MTASALPAHPCPFNYILAHALTLCIFSAATGIRACKPRVQAIREAAADVLYGEPPTPVLITLPRYGIEGVPQVFFLKLAVDCLVS